MGCVKLKSENGGAPTLADFPEDKMEPFMEGMVHNEKDNLKKDDIVGTIKARNCKPGYSCVILPESQRPAWVAWVKNNMNDQATTLSKLLTDEGKFQTEWPA